MISDIRVLFTLIQTPWRRWMAVAVVGSSLIAGLDMLGVIAMVPLMEILSGVPTHQSLLARASGLQDPLPLILAGAGIVGLAFILKSVLGLAFRWWLLGRTTALEAAALVELLRRYLTAPYRAHRSRDITSVLRNLGYSVPQAIGQVALGFIQGLADLLTVIGISTILLIVSPWACLLAVAVFAVLAGFLPYVLRKHQVRIGETLAAAELDGWAAIHPGLNSFRESKLSASEDFFVSRYANSRAQRAKAMRQLSIINELPKYALEIGFVISIGAIAALMFSIYPASDAIAVLGVFAAAATRLLPTLNRLVATATTIRVGRAALRISADEVQKLEVERSMEGIPDCSVRVDSRSNTGDIFIDDVHFRFPDSDENVLKGVSLTIREGETTALVGTSGAGKSTLLDIILGLLRPTHGDVYCGAVSIFDNLEAWQRAIGVVPQEVYLMDDTLRRNVAFGSADGDIDDKRVQDVLRMAELTTVVEELPDGLDTKLGERGVRLSGGQRQRVGIARALYRNPRILVLDEATSALDNVTEERITETVKALSGDMTVLVVAHRLSTVRDAHKIIFMSQGQVATEGTFDEVRVGNSEFASLVELGRLP